MILNSLSFNLTQVWPCFMCLGLCPVSKIDVHIWYLVLNVGLVSIRDHILSVSGLPICQNHPAATSKSGPKLASTKHNVMFIHLMSILNKYKSFTHTVITLLDIMCRHCSSDHDCFYRSHKQKTRGKKKIKIKLKLHTKIHSLKFLDNSTHSGKKKLITHKTLNITTLLNIKYSIVIVYLYCRKAVRFVFLEHV